MHRIDTPNAQKDKFGAGKNGFTRGNPQTGTPATELDDDYFDMLQEELLGVVEASGAAADKSKRNQLLTALKTLLLSRSNPFADIKSDGAASIAAALSNLGLKEAAKREVGNGVNQIPDMSFFSTLIGSVGGSGYVTLPGGIIIQWGPITISANEVMVNVPLLYPNALLHAFAVSGYTIGGTAAAVASFGTALIPGVRGSFTARCTSPTIGGRYLTIGY